MSNRHEPAPDADRRSTTKGLAVGLGSGIAIGVGLGTAMHNLAIGIAIGIVFGAGLGNFIDARARKRNKGPTQQG